MTISGFCWLHLDLSVVIMMRSSGGSEVSVAAVDVPGKPSEMGLVGIVTLLEFPLGH